MKCPDTCIYHSLPQTIFPTKYSSVSGIAWRNFENLSSNNGFLAIDSCQTVNIRLKQHRPTVFVVNSSTNRYNYLYLVKTYIVYDLLIRSLSSQKKFCLGYISNYLLAI